MRGDLLTLQEIIEQATLRCRLELKYTLEENELLANENKKLKEENEQLKKKMDEKPQGKIGPLSSTLVGADLEKALKELKWERMIGIKKDT